MSQNFQNISFRTIVGHFVPNFALILAEIAQFWNFFRHAVCTWLESDSTQY